MIQYFDYLRGFKNWLQDNIGTTQERRAPAQNTISSQTRLKDGSSRKNSYTFLILAHILANTSIYFSTIVFLIVPMFTKLNAACCIVAYKQNKLKSMRTLDRYTYPVIYHSM